MGGVCCTLWESVKVAVGILLRRFLGKSTAEGGQIGGYDGFCAIKTNKRTIYSD